MSSPLTAIPGIGVSLAQDLENIGIHVVRDLRGVNPDDLYSRSNHYVDSTQDPCVLYAFRCAIYYANTPETQREPAKLKWWNWKDIKA